MTKSALAGLTRNLAAEWGRHNIQVNCIAPGFIVTDLNRDMWQRTDMKQWLSGAQSAPGTGTPEDIAALAVYLSGKGSNFVTGQTSSSTAGTARQQYGLSRPRSSRVVHSFVRCCFARSGACRMGMPDGPGRPIGSARPVPQVWDAINGRYTNPRGIPGRYDGKPGSITSLAMRSHCNFALGRRTVTMRICN